MNNPPYDTGKVKIGLTYVPPPPTSTPESEWIQGILLGDKQGMDDLLLTHNTVHRTHCFHRYRHATYRRNLKCLTSRLPLKPHLAKPYNNGMTMGRPPPLQPVSSCPLPPTNPTQTITMKKTFNITNNISRVTFDYIKNNPRLHTQGDHPSP